MKTYLLQMVTKDLGLMLKTEVSADTIPDLQVKAFAMVSSNPVKGMTYRIFEITKMVAGGFEPVMVKQDVVAA